MVLTDFACRPVNFREDFQRSGSNLYWNHNYFMAQSDEPSEQQFFIIPWDMEPASIVAL